MDSFDEITAWEDCFVSYVCRCVHSDLGRDAFPSHSAFACEILLSTCLSPDGYYQAFQVLLPYAQIGFAEQLLELSAVGAWASKPPL
jgi:hypothetical protein